MEQTKTYGDFDIFELALIRESNNNLRMNANLAAASPKDHIAIYYDNSEIDYVITEKINAMTTDELEENLNKASNFVMNNPDNNAAYVFLVNKIQSRLNHNINEKFIR